MKINRCTTLNIHVPIVPIEGVYNTIIIIEVMILTDFWVMIICIIAIIMCYIYLYNIYYINIDFMIIWLNKIFLSIFFDLWIIKYIFEYIIGILIEIKV